MPSEQNQGRESTAEIARRARQGLWHLASSNLIWQIISWFLTILTVRFLAPTDFGMMALTETFVPYLTIIASLDLLNWVVQERDFPPEKEESVFTLAIVVGGIVSGAGFVIAPLVAWFYGHEELEIPFLIVACSFFIRSLGTVPESKLRRELRFKPIALINMSVGISRGLVQLVLAYYGFGFYALLVGFVYRDIVHSVAMIVTGKLPRRLRWEKPVIRSAFFFGLPSTAATILWIVYTSSHNIVVGKLFGAEALSFYAMAFFLVDLPLAKLNLVLRPVIIPYLSRLKEDMPELRARYLRVVSATTLVSFPAIAGLGLVATELVPLLLGRPWIPLIIPLQTVALIGIIRAGTNVFSPLFLALGKPKLDLWCNLLGAIVFPPTLVLTGIWFGMQGIYTSWFLLLPLLGALMLTFLYRETGIGPGEYLRSITPSFICTMIMIFCTTILGLILLGRFPTWLVLLAKIAGGACVYLLVARLFFGRGVARFLVSLGIEDQVSKK